MCWSSGLLGLEGNDLTWVSEGLFGLPKLFDVLPGERTESLLSDPSFGEDDAAAFSAFLHLARRF